MVALPARGAVGEAPSGAAGRLLVGGRGAQMRSRCSRAWIGWPSPVRETDTSKALSRCVFRVLCPAATPIKCNVDVWF